MNLWRSAHMFALMAAVLTIVGFGPLLLAIYVFPGLLGPIPILLAYGVGPLGLIIALMALGFYLWAFLRR
ncbi:hypothetical protein [Cucumibacter marinus]|jgi:hypothetical protein|uniref:hypothetical protein n=1 Tax=Cucumibacter marinus TaxID=1121252 RepID=UPI000404C12E|nr:hypothetical protein [Cucumibacter marinus]